MDDARLTSISLAARGFGAGNPETIMQLPVETVMDMNDYVAFERDYIATKAELNKPDNA